MECRRERRKLFRPWPILAAAISIAFLLGVYYFRRETSPYAIHYPIRQSQTAESHSGHSEISTLAVGGSLDASHLRSPSGQYQFSLKPSGEFVLEDLNFNKELFSSDTSLGWPVKWHSELSEKGELVLTWTHPTERPFEGTPWISSMLPDCYPIETTLVAQRPPPVLELHDTGKLEIRSGDQTLCVLHRANGDAGRLAIIYPGFLRTFQFTCADHTEKLIQHWNGSGGVDVHVFGYLEDSGLAPVDSNPENLTSKLRECFGENLKTVQLSHVDDVKEEWPDRSRSAEGRFCGQVALDRQLSQFKTTYLAGQQVRRYMIENAVQYNYVLKFRLDLALWGDAPSLDPLLLPPDGIIVPRPTLDWVWYSLLHDDTLRAGVTDIAAFGRPSAMFTYMDLYRELTWLRKLEKSAAVFKATNTHRRRKVDITDPETCTPENILAYWLELNGIQVATDWRWKMAILRHGGRMKYQCPNSARTWNCPDFIPYYPD